MTLFEAIALVLIVIYLFLGSLRAALIPAVTVPVCLVAAFIALYAFGFSINLLTLLALVLCIGLVVDDAIVVLENIQRRADLGEPPMVAALRGTKQVAFAVISTTAVLVAVFLPIGFLEGNTGRLFRELSVALAGAIAISAFVALTLTPMMSSKLVRKHEEPRGLHAWIGRQLTRTTNGYRRSVQRTSGHPIAFGALLLLAIASIYGVFLMVPSELAPPEDRGSFFVMVQGRRCRLRLHGRSGAEGREDHAGYLGEGQPLQRANARVPGGFGASEEMPTARSSCSSRTGTSAMSVPPRWSNNCAENSASCRRCARCRRYARD